jgi:very-short-patch-repair endonuclease
MPKYRVPDEQRDFAKKLRREQTALETRLWHEIRAKRLDDWKFRRQVPIGPYVVDFVCFEARLIVEADGPLHRQAENRMHDARRDAVLQERGFRILRFDADVALGRMVEDIRLALSFPPLPTLR